MNFNDILTLARAGFNFDQISTLYQLQNVQQLPVQQTAVQQLPVQQLPVQQTAVQQLPVQQTAVQQLPVQQTPVPSFDQLFGRMDNLINTIQSSNIMTSTQPTIQTADDILAEIINPKQGGKINE